MSAGAASRDERAGTPRVLIVGGGIGGLTAAAALRPLKLDLQLVEHAEVFEVVGAGITIQANANAVLDALGIRLPEDDVISIGSVQVVDARGRRLTGGDTEQMLTGVPSINIHRADLHDRLLRACEDVPLQTGRPVEAVTAGRDAVEVRFADGTREPFDLVVGADGMNSTLRRSLAGGSEPAPRYSGQTCWRFALEAPDLVPQVTVERWSRQRRAGIVPLSRGRIYVYLVESAPAGTPGEGSAAPSLLREKFGDIDAGLDAMLERLDESAVIHHGDLCDRPAVDFGRGRVVLIGDAAHAMTPNAGQGAGTAIEDAAALALLLREDPTTLDGVPARLDAMRRQRVESILRTAWHIGQVAHWKNPLACRLRDALMRAMPSSAVDAQARRLWEPGIELAARIRSAA